MGSWTSFVLLAALFLYAGPCIAGSEEANQDKSPQHHTSEHGKLEGGRLVKQEGDATAFPLVGLSALRDPSKRREIRVFFDALDPVAETIKCCHFHQDDLTTVPNNLGKEVEGRLQIIESHDVISGEALDLTAAELAETHHGWHVTCRDPDPPSGPLEGDGLGQYQHKSVSLHAEHNGTRVYTRLAVETIATKKRHTLGACVGPLFSHRVTLQPWLQYHEAMGVGHVTIYQAKLTHHEGLRDAFGIFKVDPRAHLREAEYERTALVDWRVFSPPAMRYFAGQSTVYNDCLFRNRWTYDFLLIVDTDEVVKIKSPGFQNDLPGFLHVSVPLLASAYMLPRVLYPRKCCQLKLGVDRGYFDSCQHFTEADHSNGKMVVRPSLAEAITTHYLLQHISPSVVYEFADVNSIVLKHVKTGASYGIESDLNCNEINVER